MAEPANPEGEKQTSLAEQIWIAMEKRPGNSEYIKEPRRRRQELVLQNLPLDFETRMKAFVYNEGDKDRNQLFPILFGGIFEELVRADKNICPKSEDDEEILIRTLLKEPDMANLQDRGIDHRVRSPDIARVNKEGEIAGAVEIKTKFNQRSLEQLRVFKKNFEKLVDKLQAIGEEDPEILRVHGLSPIADNLDKLKVADNFKVTIAYPYLKPFNGKVEKFVDPKKFNSPKDYEEMIKRLEECEFIQSPFGKGDLVFITVKVIKWLEENNQAQFTGKPLQEYEIPQI